MPKPNKKDMSWLDESPLVEETAAQTTSADKEYQNTDKGGGPNADPKDAPRSKMDAIAQGAGNLLAGAVRGAGSIGATLVAPYDMAKDALNGKGVSLESNRQRRADMDAGLEAMGAEPESWMYQGGKLAGEIAGTAGAGGVLANGVRAAGATRAMTGLEPITNAIAAGLETGGFRVGELAGTVPGAVTRVATGAATGGVSAAMVNPEDAGVGAVIGAASPAVVKEVLGKAVNKSKQAIRSVVGDVSPEVRQLATRAEELGIKIPADRLVDSKALNATAASLEYMPFSGRTGSIDAMNAQLNRALSRTFGQDSPNVTGAMRKAADDLGGKFDAVLRANTVKISPAFKDALAEAENQATNELGPEGASIIHKQIASILTKGAGGEIDGQAAYNVKKTLDRIGQRNTPEAFYARDLKKSLMDALNDSLGAEQAQSFKTLRQQYGNMMALQNLARNGVDGEISVARLANLKHINNPDLQELADIAAQFVKPREGAHGAAQRVSLPVSLGGAGAAGVVGGAVAGPATIAGVVGTLGAGRLANKALNSQAVRNAILKPAVQAGAQPSGMSSLAKGATRALPLLGASTMAGAQPTSEPDNAWLDESPLVDETPGAAEPQQPADAQPAAPTQPAFQSQPRPDGTLAISGDTQALRTMLAAAGIPARSMAPMKGGLLIGRFQAGKVQEAIDRMNAPAPAPEEMAVGTDALAGTMAEAAPAEGQDMPQELASNQALTTVDSAQAAMNSGAKEDAQPASIDIAAHGAATSPQNELPEPTLAQQRAGNYKLGHDRIAGMDVSIENPQGSVRRGVDPDGKPWETQMQHHYGYFKKTTANDGDKLDVFIKPGTPRDFAGPVFVIDQVDPRTGKLDEHKTIMGAANEQEAQDIYKANYSADWQGMGSITRLPMPVFKAWAASGSKKEPLGDLLASREVAPATGPATTTAQDDSIGAATPPSAAPAQAMLARIEKLQAAGEKEVASMLQRSFDREQAVSTASNELAEMRTAAPDLPHHQAPEFASTYARLRSAGAKPAEAAARAGLLAAVTMQAPEMGMSEKAAAALNQKLSDLPLDAAPGFAQRFVAGLVKRGVIQGSLGAEKVGATLEQYRDGAMHAMVKSAYDREIA